MAQATSWYKKFNGFWGCLVQESKVIDYMEGHMLKLELVRLANKHDMHLQVSLNTDETKALYKLLKKHMENK